MRSKEGNGYKACSIFYSAI
jgi:group I intron endonuclease